MPQCKGNFCPRRSQGIGSSPVCLWPPSSRPCRCRCFLPLYRLSSSQTTVAGNLRCLALMTQKHVFLRHCSNVSYFPEYHNVLLSPFTLTIAPILEHNLNSVRRKLNPNYRHSLRPKGFFVILQLLPDLQVR